jgi:hypothetical protein
MFSYFACESLYNVVKICRSSTLTHFEQLFNALWKLSCDTEQVYKLCLYRILICVVQTVRSGAELLDRLVKEIVRNSPEFDVHELMLLIRERIYTNNSSNRRFIISWVCIIFLLQNTNVLLATYRFEDARIQYYGICSWSCGRFIPRVGWPFTSCPWHINYGFIRTSPLFGSRRGRGFCRLISGLISMKRLL